MDGQCTRRASPRSCSIRRPASVPFPGCAPHFGKRPPFSPGKSPAPFLEPIHRQASGANSADVSRPGENGPWSLCPREAGSPSQHKRYNIHAISTPITLSKAMGEQPAIVDPQGQLYVLHEEEEKIRANDELKIPLVVRMNVRRLRGCGSQQRNSR